MKENQMKQVNLQIKVPEDLHTAIKIAAAKSKEKTIKDYVLSTIQAKMKKESVNEND
jgi:uncharacterized protein (DUF1778 family)